MAFESNPFIVAEAPAADRAAFYRRTYAHVAGAFAAFAALLFFFFYSGVANTVMSGLGSLIQATRGFGWLIVLLAFWGGTFAAQTLASNRASRGSQYAGLGLYVVLEALIFIPLIWMTAIKTDGHPGEILVPACALTGALVVGLSVAVFATGLDFSFLRVAIIIGSLCALGAIIVFSIMGINPGTWFALAMIVLMASVILYQTWVIKDSCETDQHVFAAFILFSAFVTLLWYVISFFLGRRNE